MLAIVIIISVGVGVTASIVGVAFALKPTDDDLAENRLSILTGQKKAGGAQASEASLLTANSLSETKSLADELLLKFGNISNLMQQADVSLSATQFIGICGVLAVVGAVVVLVTPCTIFLLPFVSAAMGSLPLLWLILKHRKRMKRFNEQLPEALELLSRSLRAGHSLAAGFGLIGREMPDPIAREFGRAFEEQNLGITLDEALEDMTVRVPNMDLRFFATAVLLQRQTGGDLAEILDKIGSLIRERFKLAGQIQALTGEGRLSGIVLLALPPTLLLVMLYLNYDYAMVLFTDPTGKQLLAAALALQFVGAMVIRKIINIKA